MKDVYELTNQRFRIIFWDITSKTETHSFLTEERIHGIAYSADSNYVVFGVGTYFVSHREVFDIQSGQQICKLDIPELDIYESFFFTRQ